MTSLESDPRFQRLRLWLEGLGGATHASLEVYLDPVCGTSLRAKPQAAAPVTGLVVSCPLAASLSYLNAVAGGPCFISETPATARSPAFPPAFMDAVPPHVIGRFFLVQQFLRGPASHWYPYIAALPQPDDFAAWGLPAVWRGRNEEAASALLRGTNAAVAAQTMAELIAAEYSQAAAVLGADADADAASYTLALYEWAYCMFTSRSFRPSLVLPDGGGATYADDFSVLLPMLDLGNHDPAARVAWERSAPLLSSDANSQHAPASVDFCALDAYAPGAQVFNNYGSKTNSELLVGYGFVLPATRALHNDYVHLRKMGGPSALMAATAATNTADAPPSFLLGLRSMTDASSVVGRGRARLTAGRARLAEFGRFEDGLLWDMLLGISSAAEREQLTRYAGAAHGVAAADAPMEAVYAAAPVAELQAAIMDMVFSAEEEDGDDDDEKEEFCLQKADAVRQALTYKMYMDCKTLRSTDAGQERQERQGQARQTGFEALAAQYREQYRAVLEAAFKSLSGEDYESSDEE